MNVLIIGAGVLGSMYAGLRVEGGVRYVRRRDARPIPTTIGELSGEQPISWTTMVCDMAFRTEQTPAMRRSSP